MKFTPNFMKNGRSFKSRGEIFIRGRGYNTLVLSLHIALELHEPKHLSFTHEHHHMLMHLFVMFISRNAYFIYVCMPYDHEC